MSPPVHLEVFYPYPPERLWQVLTNRRALAAWMMENDFEPTLGHKFQFYRQLLPGLTTAIQCQVVELEEPTRLVYTWQESATSKPSLVIWTLTTVAGGTQLRLKHHQYSYIKAAMPFEHPDAGSRRRSGSFYRQDYSPVLELEIQSRYSPLRSNPLPLGLDIATALELPVLHEFPWTHYLNQTLPNLLAQDALPQDELSDG